MKHTVNVSSGVMERVYVWEKHRIARWLCGFLLTIGALVVLFGSLLWVSAVTVANRQTLDLLALLREDREIIAEFWQDTLLVMVTELPWKSIVFGVGVGCILVIYILATRSKRLIMRRKMHQLREYQKEAKK